MLPVTEPLRKYYFDHLEYSKQDETLQSVRLTANQSLLISRMDSHLDINEFKKICTILPGKSKAQYSLARHSDLLFKKQVIVTGFDN